MTCSSSSPETVSDRAPVFASIGLLLQSQALTRPDAAAVLSADGVTLSYAELWRMVSDLVHDLRRSGLGPADRVAVVLPRGPDNALALIAVAAGCVCVPVNPDFTPDELLRYFSELRLRAVLIQAGMASPSRGVAHTLNIPVIDVSRQGHASFAVSAAPIGAPSDCAMAVADDDAFILLTSGTASRPKMVPLTQAAVCRSAFNAGAVLGLRPGDRLLNALPLFHAHGLISGLLTALAARSSVIVTEGFDPHVFYRCLRTLQPTWYTAVPTIHRALLSAAAGHADDIKSCALRVIRSASSSLPPLVLQGLESLFGVPVVETYGMTEGASQIAANPLSLRKPGSVGLPAGPEIAIMDEHGQPLAAGARGEIVLRGPTMTRGYCDDETATTAAFRDGWFRTGDLGCLDEDGYLFIVGRIKEIINRGGQKVSPEEVEQVLLRHPDILEAAAFAMPHQRLGETVAVAVVAKPDASVSTEVLRQFASGQLAGYKVPSAIYVTKTLPKGASGKVKRSALAGVFANAAPPEAPADGPVSDAERRLAAIWQGLLECDRVGVDQNVFALGADSILVTQFLSRLRDQFKVRLSFADVFDAPTVRALAQRLDAKSGREVVPAWKSPRGAAMPLSFQQQRIHLLDRLDPTGTHYNVVESMRLSGALDAAALAAAIAAIGARHDVLRMRVVDREGGPGQTIAPGAAELRIEARDHVPPGDRDAEIRRELRAVMQQRIDLAAQPPLHARLLRLADDDHVLIIAIHHIATDGWSQRLFWDELKAHYAGHRGLPAQAPAPLAIQYRHYIGWQQAWLRTRGAREQLAYWQAQLGGLTPLPLRTDHPRRARWRGRGARHHLTLPLALSDAIRRLSQAEGVTPFMTLLAALQCLLFRLTAHEDIAVGSLIANRNQIEVERLIGMFANTVLLRGDLSGTPTFRELLGRVRKVTLDAYRNQDLPLEEVLRTLPLPRGQDAQALVQVMFILQNATTLAPTLPGLTVTPVEIDPGIARFDLTLELNETGAAYAGFLEYDTDLYEPDTIARMARQLETLLRAAVAAPSTAITRVAILPEDERRRLLELAAGPQRDIATAGDLCASLAVQAKHKPDEIAISHGAARLSYRELARQSDGIAERLIGTGLGRDAIVAVLAPRSPDLIAAMLGIHRAGAAFLNLDPAQPARRLTEILQGSGARALIVHRDCAELAGRIADAMPAGTSPDILMLDDIAPASRVKPPPRHGDAGLAYVISTSGSSGAPKGVLVERRGLANHLAALIAELGLSPADVIAQTAPQSFVISVWQCLAGLLAGARVHVIATETVREPLALAGEITSQGVTVLQIVPSLLRVLLDTEAPAVRKALSGLRVLIATGEPLSADLCRRWFQRCPGVPLVNAYGASECSDDVTLHWMTAAPDTAGAAPIGRPLPNMQVHILDAQAQPAPIGAVGEICIGGAGVARGYINDPDRTQARFMPDPFAGGAARLYRTGDLGRWRSDGTLECLGRGDRQIKLRGHRIELAEIEQALCDHPAIRLAAVEPHGETDDERRLVAHLVAKSGLDATASALRGFLKLRLPEAMIPAAFLFVDQLPLNAHGKIDRAALRARPAEDAEAPDAAAPSGETERRIAAIWAEVLKRRNVGLTDNFFELGGHSLLAARVMARIAETMRVSLPIKALFQAPTVGALAAAVAQAAVTRPPLQVMPLPLAPAQADRPSLAQVQMIRMERMLPGLPQFNLPFALRLQGPLDIKALRRSIDAVVRRHDALRMGFAGGSDEPTLVMLSPEQVDGVLRVERLSSDTDESPRAAALRARAARLSARQEAWTPFDVGHGPLLRARLLRLCAEDHVLLLTFHHAVADGWSIGLVFDEISRLYAAKGRTRALPQPAGFADFAEWQRAWCDGADAVAQARQWSKALRGAAPLFGTKARPVVPRPAARSGHQAIQLPAALVKRIDTFSRGDNGTRFMTLLTALNVLLMARTGRTDICIATSMANRTRPGSDGVVGPFENTVIIRTRLDPALSFRDAFARVRLAVLDAHARQELPFDVLAARLAEEGIDPAGLIQVYVTLQNPLRQPLRLPEVAVRSFGDIAREGQPVLPINQTCLSLMLKERTAGITGSLGYKTDLFAAEAMAQWVTELVAILEAGLARPNTALARLVKRRAA